MSANRHLAPGVDTKMLNTHFAVMTDAVRALIFPVSSKKILLTVNIVRSFSYFFGFTLHTIFPYVTFLSFGTCALGIKMTVFVPFTIMIPWVNCTSSFTKDISQIFLSGPLTRCLYSWETPDIWSVTALAPQTFCNFSVNTKCAMGFFLPLDLSLELVPSVSTLGGCTVCTLGGGTGTSGRIIFGPEGEISTLFWKSV